MKDQLQNLESNIHLLREKNSDFEKQLAAATTKIATLKLTVEKNDEQHMAERHSLQRQLDDAKHEITVHLKTIADLNDEINAMTNKISKISDQIDLKNGLLTVRDAEITGLKENEQKLLEIKSKIEMELKSQVKENIFLSTIKDDLEEQLKLTSQNFEQNKKALADLHEEYTNTTDAMTRKISKLSDDIDSRNSQIKDRDNKIKLLQENENKLSDIKAKLKKKIIELELKLKSMKHENYNLQSTVADLEAQLKKSKTLITTLETNCNENQSEISELVAEIQTIKLEFANASTAILSREEQITDFLVEIGNLQDTLKKLRVQIASLKTSLKEKEVLLLKLESAEAIRNAKLYLPKSCQTEEGGIRTSPGVLGFDHVEHDFQWEDKKIIITAKVNLLSKDCFKT